MKTISELINLFNTQHQKYLVFDDQNRLIMENRNGVLLNYNFESNFQTNQGWNTQNYGIQAANMTENLIEFIVEIESLLVNQEAEKEGLLIQKDGNYYPCGLGICHSVWALKKSRLREKYGIIWQSPAELNPNILFD